MGKRELATDSLTGYYKSLARAALALYGDTRETRRAIEVTLRETARNGETDERYHQA